MKTFWNNIPAWLRAIILNLLLLLPLVIFIQSIVWLNFQIKPEWGWALLVVIPILVLFFKLAKKWNPFNNPEDIRLELKFNRHNKKHWYRLAALVLITFSVIQLSLIAFNIETIEQIEALERFRILSPMAAIPLLLAMALTAGILEEVVYRSLILNTLLVAYPKWVAFFGVSILFAIMHFLPLPLIFSYILVSLAYCFVAYELKFIGVLIVAHVLVDFILFLNIYFDAVDLFNSTATYFGIGALLLGVVLLFAGNPLVLRSKKSLDFQI